MEIDYSKLLNASKTEIGTDVSEIDEILEQEEILFSISKKMILYRTQHNLTQKELAKKLNVNQTMISKLESGNYNPTFKQIYKISRKLTHSSDMFKEILQEILDNLNNITKINIVTKLKNEINIPIENCYSNKNSNIVYISNYTNKGDINYEQYTSRDSIVG